MAEPFLGEIRPFAFPFAPKGWHLCDGALLSIAQNTALFSILGTTYGGNGTTTFALPDLRGRVPVNVDPYGSVSLGQMAGEMVHVLNINEMPAHNHLASANSSAASSTSATGNTWGTPTSSLVYADSANVNMKSNALPTTGGSQPHDNMQPYLVMNFCIAVQGIYPSRN